MARKREEIESQFRHVHSFGDDKKYVFQQVERQEIVNQLQLEVLLDIRDALAVLKDKLEYGVGIYNAS